MFILSGTMMVAGAVWVVMYNSDLLLAGIMALFGRMRALAPVLKTAVSYPMASRFRTGMALAMFSLIVFTLVVMSGINASFNAVLGDTDRVTGGFHIRGEVNYNNPIPDIETALDVPGGVGADNFRSVSSLSYLPAKIRDADGDQEWDDLFLAGVDRSYTSSVTYDFDLMTEDYDSPQDVWRALSDDPSLAVVSAAVVPSKGGEMGGDGVDLKVGGGRFYIEDEILPPDIYIETQSAFGGQVQKLRVIGVIDVMAGPYAAPVTTSQETVNTVAGLPWPPTSFRFQVEPENVAGVPELARGLEKQFLENGMNTEVMAQEVRDFGRMQEMFMNLMMAFMGLGLIVGIAALGVIAARSVVERRQQIGMLRAIGFGQHMIQASFLLESSFVALLGILLGVALGIAIVYQIMPDAGVEGMTAVIPWTRIVLIVGLAYLASLLTTFLPAYQAARVYPAEALRYE
jgi:putative ABC transport system permease protein